MFQVLRNSLLTLNHHGDLRPFANNMRLFEATGVGTLLITDWKENIHAMFEPGKEVIPYRSPEECVELVQCIWNTKMSGRPLLGLGRHARCAIIPAINGCRAW